MVYEKYRHLLDEVDPKEPAPEGDIRDVESRLGTSFPCEYRKFLLSRNGFEGPLGEECYLAIYPLSTVEVISISFRNSCLMNDVVVIGGDGGGEYLCLIPGRYGDNVLNYPAIGADVRVQPDHVASSIGEVIVLAAQDRLTLPPLPRADT